jgi:HSP20 family protein
MSVKSLMKKDDFLPSILDDFFKPWNSWSESDFEKRFSAPSVNITENKDDYKINVAAPGLTKNDFKINVDGNLLTISAEKEEKKDEKEKNFTRREYNYSSFSRTFTLPDGVNADKIDAIYENGELKLSLPKKDEVKKIMTKSIVVK